MRNDFLTFELQNVIEQTEGKQKKQLEEVLKEYQTGKITANIAVLKAEEILIPGTGWAEKKGVTPRCAKKR